MKKVFDKRSILFLPMKRKNYLKKIPLILLLLLMQLSNLSAFAQTEVRGTVRDSKGDALVAVTVAVKGGAAVTKTDLDGVYSIKVGELNSVLVFTSVGFESKEVIINEWKNFDVVLEGTASILNEVIVIGYGKNTRELLTTSVSKLDTRVLENIPYANATSALQGTIAGLRVQTGSGQPGDAPRVILRGGTSINNPNGALPLYIVDGVTRTSMNEIAADDIESIQVLKDAASTAIYGSRGSNGVVIITTKSGKAGRTSINYSYDLTVSEVGHMMEYASARDYIEQSRISIVATAVKNPALLARNQLATGSGTGNDLTNNTAYTTMYLTPENQHKLNEGWESMPDPLDPSKTIIFKETDYADILYRTAVSHNHYLSVSGGSERSTFNLGVGYLNGQGIAIATDYKRLTLNLNGTVKVARDVEVTGRVLYGNSTKGSPVANNAITFYRSVSLPGTAKYRFEDGTMAPGQSSSIGNPDYHMRGPYADQGENSYDNITIAISGRAKILPGLSFEPQISLYKARSDGYLFRPTSMRNGVGTLTTSRDANSTYSKTTQYEASAVLTYEKTFGGAHNLEAKVGGSYFGRENYSLSASGQGASTDLVPTLNAVSTPVSVSSSISDLAIEGAFSRINYHYKSKYLLSLNARYDGASNLGRDKRWGFFPGMSVGWNIHNEDFWDIFPEFISSLKLRGSYGVNGNISGLSDFQAQGSYSVGSRYNGNPAIISSVFPTPELQWEESQTKDIGFDLGLFNRRVNLLFDYYSRETKSLLTTVSLPPSTGFSSVLTNLGNLGNKGVEIELNAQVLRPGSAIQWYVGFNFSKVKTKILKLPDNGVERNRVGGFLVYDPTVKDYRYLGGLQEGGRVGDMYAYELIGVYATDQDAANGPVDMIVNGNDKTKYGGDAIFLDVDGNNIIDDKDRVYVGNPYPTWNGGFTNTIEYKNLFLTIRTDFTGGHTIYNYPRVFADGQLQTDALPTKEFLAKSWKKQGDITMVPRYIWGNQQQNLRPHSANYEKADFLCLREITLGYTISPTLLKKIGFKSVRLNITGNNLHYFTKYKGNVPEDGETGQDNGHYPIPRNFIFGANIIF